MKQQPRHESLLRAGLIALSIGAIAIDALRALDMGSFAHLPVSALAVLAWWADSARRRLAPPAAAETETTAQPASVGAVTVNVPPTVNAMIGITDNLGLTLEGGFSDHTDFLGLGLRIAW